MEDYRTVRGTATGEYEEKKSRFIAQLSFADSEEAAVAFLEQVRAANRTARHNVYAYRLRAGNRERYSDDGEPAKTAGTPALEVLQHSGLTDLIVVVTRYFGGVLLGTGGLVRAYTTATARALENAEVVTVRSVVELQVTVDYALYERASLLIDAAGAKQAPPEFTDRVTLRWQMPEHTEAPLLEQLRELTRGSAQVTVSDPFYAPFKKTKSFLQTDTELPPSTWPMCYNCRSAAIGIGCAQRGGEKPEKQKEDLYGCASENRGDRTPYLCTVGDLQRCKPWPRRTGAAGPAAPGVPAGSRPGAALQGLPASQAENAGVPFAGR